MGSDANGWFDVCGWGGMERLRHSGWRVGTEGDWMGLLMLACVSLETFAITDHL